MTLSTRILLWTAILTAGFCGLYLLWPRFDIWVADWIYLGDNQFILNKTQTWYFYKDVLRPGFRVLLIALVLWAAWVLWRKPERRRANMRKVIFVLLAVLLGPILVVDAGFKSHYGRARPFQITEFGGDKIYTSPLVASDQCQKNCSFVSGEAAALFASIALAMLATRRRGLWIAVSVFLGLVIGAMRMGVGKHFFGDIVFAGLIVVAVTALCYRFMLEGHEADPSTR